MASFLKRKENSASLENHFSGINIGLEEEMIMTKDADNEVDSAEAEGFDKLKFKVDEFKEFVNKKEIRISIHNKCNFKCFLT